VDHRHELKPKAVARDLYERGLTFNEYVAFYGLGRSEGLVLRSFADAYKALKRSVPDALRTDEVDELTEWLGELVRQVDSSLLDEWSEMTAQWSEQCRHASTAATNEGSFRAADRTVAHASRRPLRRHLAPFVEQTAVHLAHELAEPLGELIDLIGAQRIGDRALQRLVGVGKLRSTRPSDLRGRRRRRIR